jgi:hypothetical protein
MRNCRFSQSSSISGVWLAILVCLSCRPPVPSLGPDVTSELRNATLAAGGGPGGCVEPGNLAQTPNRFFAGISLYEGSCVMEHGDSFSVLLASDSVGRVLILDSPSAFRYLLKTHHPMGIGDSTVGEFARLALVMSGKLTPRERPAMIEVERLPAGMSRSSDTTSASKSQTKRLVLLRLAREPHGRTLQVLVDMPSGESIPIEASTEP